jgi:hypothetical protein
MNTYIVHIEREGGARTTFTQQAVNMVAAITDSLTEHRNVWGYSGTAVFAEAKAAGIVTADGRTVRRGDRVFNYYDRVWGTIMTDPASDGWFTFRAERPGSRDISLNGERISAREHSLR